MTSSTLDLVVEIPMIVLMDFYEHECRSWNHFNFDPEEFLQIHYDIFERDDFKHFLIIMVGVIAECLYDANEDELTLEDRFFEEFDDNLGGHVLDNNPDVSLDAIKIYIETLVKCIEESGVEEIFEMDLLRFRREADVYFLSFANLL